MEHTPMDTNVQKARNLSAMACTKIRDTNVQKARNPTAMACTKNARATESGAPTSPGRLGVQKLN